MLKMNLASCLCSLGCSQTSIYLIKHTKHSLSLSLSLSVYLTSLSCSQYLCRKKKNIHRYNCKLKHAHTDTSNLKCPLIPVLKHVYTSTYKCHQPRNKTLCHLMYQFQDIIGKYFVVFSPIFFFFLFKNFFFFWFLFLSFHLYLLLQIMSLAMNRSHTVAVFSCSLWLKIREYKPLNPGSYQIAATSIYFHIHVTVCLKNQVNTTMQDFLYIIFLKQCFNIYIYMFIKWGRKSQLNATIFQMT